MIDDLLHLVFPRVCIICRKLLIREERFFCAECFGDFEPFSAPEQGEQALMRIVESHFGLKSLPARAWCRYAFHRSAKFRDAIHAMKYEGIFPLGAMFGHELGELIGTSPGAAGIGGIVPVPLHSLKKIERSFNQAELIAAGIAEVLGKPLLTGVIARTKNTASQTGLSLRDRRRNMEGAFRPGKKACPRNVLLVDDVLTTGSTLVSASGVLAECGAESVSFAVVALTEKE